MSNAPEIELMEIAEQVLSDSSRSQPVPPAVSIWNLTLIVLNLCLAPFYFGYALVYLSTIEFDSLIRIFSIPLVKSTAQGILTSCIPIGGCLGALSSYLLLKWLSRRQCMLAVNLLALLVGFCLLIPNFYTLLLFRLLQGACCGVYTVVTPMMIKQLSPIQLSGSLGCLNQLFLAFGIFFAYFFGYILSQLYHDPTASSVWWVIFIFPLITVSFQTFILVKVFPYETPKYLLLIGQEGQCRQLLSVIYPEQAIDQILQEKYRDFQFLSPKDIENQETEVSTSRAKAIPQSSRPAVITAVNLAIVQHFIGINAVIAYGGEITASTLPQLERTFPILISLIQVLGTIVSSYLISRIGRKTLLTVGMLVSLMSTLLMFGGFLMNEDGGQQGAPFILIGMAVFLGNFGMSLGPVIWLYIAEIVQPNVVPFSTFANRGASSLVVLFFPIITASLPNKNPAPLFLFFSFWTLLALLLYLRLGVETKNKSQAWIRHDFQQKHLC